MKPQYLDIVCVPVRDQERAKSFYTEVMGFEVVRDVRGGPAHARWIQVKPKAGQTAIALLDSRHFVTSGPVPGLVLKVNNLEECRSELKKKGVRPQEINDEDWGSHLAVDDPDGNKWILVEHEFKG